MFWSGNGTDVFLCTNSKLRIKASNGHVHDRTVKRPQANTEAPKN
jgi:hypothetical protein